MPDAAGTLRRLRHTRDALRLAWLAPVRAVRRWRGKVVAAKGVHHLPG
jgi:hypothetical protein